MQSTRERGAAQASGAARATGVGEERRLGGRGGQGGHVRSSSVWSMPLFALFIVACASALSALCATAQPRSPLSPSEQATERALDAFLTQPRYRDPDEGERRDRDRVEVWFLESLERGDLDAKLCAGVRWLITGRLKRSGGARAAFDQDPTLRDISLIFYKVKTRVTPDLSGRYTQSRSSTPVARFSISREQALSLSVERVAPLLSGPGCMEQGRALLNDIWLAEEVSSEREAIAQMERARGLGAPAPAP